jgi:Xaa-Pro aminopeptidase
MFATNANTPVEEINHRIWLLQQQLQKNRVDGALILQNADMFYFAGTIQQSHLYIPADGAPILMVRKDFDRANAESPLETIIPLKSPKKLPRILQDNGYRLPKVLGLELDVIPANAYMGYTSIFSGSRIIDLSPIIRQIRAVKSKYEIELIAQAAAFSDQVAASVKEFLTDGITEIELAGLVEGRARKLGHQGVIRMRLWGAELFYGHLMAGSSAAVPSYLSSPTGGAAISPAVAQGSSFHRIRPFEPVLVDYVFAYQGYLSDHTRIFALGDLPEELLRAHQAMLEIQRRVKTYARPGIAASDIYEQSIQWAAEMGYEEYFMGVGEQRIRFIGHGIGIELDEYPFLAEGQRLQLKEGMIIALEPKVVMPGKGVVGIENTHVVTPEGLHQLGKFHEQVTIV